VDNQRLSSALSRVEKELRRCKGRALPPQSEFEETSEAETKIAQLQAAAAALEDRLRFVMKDRECKGKELEDHKQLVYDLKSANESMKLALGRHTTQAVQAGRHSPYEALLEMAKCMAKMREGPASSLKEHVNVLVRKCVEGSGFVCAEVDQCQAEVYGHLNRVHTLACANWESTLQPGFRSYPPPNAVRQPEPVMSSAPAKRGKKRPAEEPRRQFTNDGGRAAW
jgi:hypothetical protein